MEWYQHLSRELLESAYGAEQELAWNKCNALRVVELLEGGRKYVIMGVDVWIPTKGGPTVPTPFVYDWSPGQRSPKETRQASAKEFIETFKWDPADHSPGGREPYFNILARMPES